MLNRLSPLQYLNPRSLELLFVLPPLTFTYMHTYIRTATMSTSATMSSHTSSTNSVTRGCLPHKSATPRPAVVSSSLLERARLRAERPRPWAQSSQGTSRSLATSKAALKSTTSTQGSHKSLIPPPPHTLSSQRTGACGVHHQSSSSSGFHSLIPAPRFSTRQLTTRRQGQGSLVSTSAPAASTLSAARPDSVSSYCSSASSAFISNCSSATTGSSAHTGSGLSGSGLTGSGPTGSGLTVSTGVQDSRIPRISRGSRLGQDSRMFQDYLDSRCVRAADTLSLVGSGDAHSLIPRPSGAGPPPSTLSLLTSALRPASLASKGILRKRGRRRPARRVQFQEEVKVQEVTPWMAKYCPDWIEVQDEVQDGQDGQDCQDGATFTEEMFF